MRKLRLEELRVDSFATTVAAAGPRGTIAGHAEATVHYTCVTGQQPCDAPTGESNCEIGCGTLDVTCADTCRDTCPCVSVKPCEPDPTVELSACGPCGPAGPGPI